MNEIKPNICRILSMKFFTIWEELFLEKKEPKNRITDCLHPGQIIHEVGTTRMGDDPKTSVTNKFQQLHDVDNVFVVDAGPFTSQADKNCTWTIMALSMRASEYIVDQVKQQNL